MFLLSLGELLRNGPIKKSVDDLARCMSLNVDRVWLHTQEGRSWFLSTRSSLGCHLSVRMGGLIPVDGMIVQGEVTGNQVLAHRRISFRFPRAEHDGSRRHCGGRRRVYQAPGVPAERQQPV